MGDRNAGISGRCDGGGDAGNDLKRDARRPALLRLFSAPTEDERIAALQPCHRLALFGLRDQQGIDVRLPHRVLGARLADIDLFGVGTDMLEQGGVREPIVHHDIGGAQQLHAAHGDQSGIARPGPDQVDGSGR